MRQVVYCSYLLVGVSWLFPPALLITIPIAVIATIIAGIATVTARAVQAGSGQAPAPAPAPPSDPPLPEMSREELGALYLKLRREELEEQEKGR